MEEQNQNQPENIPFPSSPNNKPKANMKIVGINLLIVVVYTIVFRAIVGGEEGLIYNAIVLIGHAIICILIAPFARKWEWAIAGLLVGAIGFATCVGALAIH